jgi:histidine phosphotransferase ChpT
MREDIVHRDGASLAALIGSRICHDLINPIGAISNGLELFGLGGASPEGPEMSLIQQSCDNATARIRFFRIAFGSADDARLIPVREAQKTLADHFEGTRYRTVWAIETDLGRNVVQLAYLAVLCLETALPQGGVVAVAIQDDALVVEGRSDTVRADRPLWDMLVSGTVPIPDLRPADVQFALLAQLCLDHGIRAQQIVDKELVRLRLPLPANDV